MTASRAITIAAIAGTILLIPVIVILSLGLYGSSIAADLAAIEPRGPKVAADPEQGPPGSSITLRGSNWIPETLARLEMVVRPSKPAITAAGEVVEEASPLPPVFIGTVITSRIGTFSVTANVPTSFPLRSGDDVDFVVTATYRGGEPAGRATGSFRIEPGPGGIEVQVYAEREGAPLPAALVELRGGQGQTLAAARADASGKALFTGLPAEARYRVMARAPGFGVLTAENVETTADAPREVTFVLSSADVAHAYVAGVPVGGAPASLVVLDLVSMVPVSAIEIVRSRPTWALAGDAGRERVYLADEVAEEIRVVDAVSGAELDPIRLAFDLHIRVTAPNGRRIEGASVRAFWLVRGDRVLVRLGETNAFGEIRFEGLITGSTYEIAVGADGYRQDIGDRPRVVVAPNVGAEITVKLEPSEGPVNSAPPVALGAPVFAQQQVPATALVVADLAVDPATGMLYVTGSDLENGHLLVLDPDRGAITIDDLDLRKYKIASLRSKVAIALQENVLFAMSVRDNIRYAAPNATDEQVEEATRIAGMDEYVSGLPDGLDTVLSDRGGKLSTGQRQRLSIARAVVRDTPILVLDEPTAALDAATEHGVMRNLAEWGRDRAIFLITHRISTIRRADTILYLDGGRIVESGSHAALMQREGGRYRAFVEAESTLTNLTRHRSA